MYLPESPTGLFWSIRGHVACRVHASRVNPDDWEAQGWSALPESSQGAKEQRYQCEYCSPEHTALRPAVA